MSNPRSQMLAQPRRPRPRPQATRIVQENNHSLSKDDLMPLEAEDIASRVFEDEVEEEGAAQDVNGQRDEPDEKDVE